MYDIEDENRFWSKILTGEIDECWEIVAMSLTKKNYGEFYVNSKPIRAHRFSYQLFHNRLIKDDMVIMHICDNTLCVNPNHLKEGTQHDNMTDMKNKGRAKGGGVRGEKQGHSKLTEKQVKEIRDKYANGGISYKQLSKDYCVHKSSIREIIKRKTWTHI